MSLTRAESFVSTDDYSEIHQLIAEELGIELNPQTRSATYKGLFVSVVQYADGDLHLKVANKYGDREGNSATYFGMPSRANFEATVEELLRKQHNIEHPTVIQRIDERISKCFSAVGKFLTKER